MESIRFVDLFEKYSLDISDIIQRPFEWDLEKTETFLKGIIDCAKKVMLDYDENKSLHDFGVLFLYKKRIGTNCDFFIDEGGHRIVSSVILVSALYKILTENLLQYDEKYRYSFVILEKVINDLKTKFKAFPSDNEDISKLLNAQDFDKLNKKNTQIQTTFLYVKEYLNILLNNNENLFSDVCNFIVKYFCFIVVTNEYTSLETRLTKYNLINNVQQEQNEVHRTISCFAEDAYKLGVIDFMRKINIAKEIINKKFPSYKNNKEKINKIIAKYLAIKIISDGGSILTRRKSDFSIVDLAQVIITSGSEDFRISFYNELFNDIELFCDHLIGIDFKLTSSKQNSINIINICAYSNLLSSPKARQFMCGIYYRIGKSVFVFNGNAIVGIKDGLTPSKVWSLIRDMHLFRFYILCLLSVNKNDERGCLLDIVKNGPIIKSDSDIDYYINFFHAKVRELINSDTFKNTCFEKASYNGVFVKIILAILDGYGNDEFEKFYDSGIKCLRNNDYDKDHVVYQKWLENPTTEQKIKINSLGNLRLLQKPSNRKENNPKKNRIIKEGDLSFPTEMWGREFTYDDIDERQKWIANVIKEKIKFLYDYKFK